MKLTINFDATHDVWFAYAGERADDSRWIGQGYNPADACADYWYQAHGSAAELVLDADNNCWRLEQDCWVRDFQTKQEAVDFANANEWQIKGKW